MAAVFVTMRELHLATSTEDACRQCLRGRGLLAANMQCPHCNTAMQERTYNRVLDGVVWRCLSQQCRATVTPSAFGGGVSFTNLRLTKLTDLIYYWSVDMKNTEVEFQVNHVSIVFM